MDKNSIKKKGTQFHHKMKMLLSVLTIVIVSGFGPATRANSSKNQKQKQRNISHGKQQRIFNPFKCKTVYVPYSKSKKGRMYNFGKGCHKINCFPKCPPVVPPCKPECRTPYKLPWWWKCHRRPSYRPWSFGRQASWHGCYW